MASIKIAKDILLVSVSTLTGIAGYVTLHTALAQPTIAQVRWSDKCLDANYNQIPCEPSSNSSGRSLLNEGLGTGSGYGEAYDQCMERARSQRELLGENTLFYEDGCISEQESSNFQKNGYELCIRNTPPPHSSCVDTSSDNYDPKEERLRRLQDFQSDSY